MTMHIFSPIHTHNCVLPGGTVPTPLLNFSLLEERLSTCLKSLDQKCRIWDQKYPHFRQFLGKIKFWAPVTLLSKICSCNLKKYKHNLCDPQQLFNPQGNHVIRASFQSVSCRRCHKIYKTTRNEHINRPYSLTTRRLTTTWFVVMQCIYLVPMMLDPELGQRGREREKKELKDGHEVGYPLLTVWGAWKKGTPQPREKLQVAHAAKG